MSNLKQKVALSGARFFAHHGYYLEEQKIGNVFYLDIVTEFEFLSGDADELETTLNYETLFEIAREEMVQTKKLLEAVVYNILHRIKAQFPFVELITVTMQKASPPFPLEVRNSIVSLTYKR